MNLTMLPPHGVILLTVLSAIVWFSWEVIMFPLWLGWHEQMDAAKRAASPAPAPFPPTGDRLSWETALVRGGDGRTYAWAPDRQTWRPVVDLPDRPYRLVTDKGGTHLEPVP